MSLNDTKTVSTTLPRHFLDQTRTPLPCQNRADLYKIFMKRSRCPSFSHTPPYPSTLKNIVFPSYQGIRFVFERFAAA
jgi:hypothetical protein